MSDGVLNYGGGSTVSTVAASENFAGASFNGLSFCCTPIELMANDGSDTVLHTASGFFWKRNNQPFLITNWHVASGRNALTGEMGSNGYIPRRIRFYGMSVSAALGIVNIKRIRWTLEWTDDEMAEVLKAPPQVDQQGIDIWGIPIPHEAVIGRDPNRTGFTGAETMSCFINDHLGTRIVTNVGDDCFILGYPLQNYEGLMLPVWKRGSIASETSMGISGRPMFLIDAATTAGMSGSPIVRRVTTFTAHNQDVGALQENAHYEVIGIYAGRLQSKELAAVNIGYGWYRTMIDGALAFYNYSAPTAVFD